MWWARGDERPTGGKMRRWMMAGMLCLATVAVARPVPEPAVVAAKMASELGLDDATEAKVESLLAAAMDEGRPLREKAHTLGAELKIEREKPDPDMKKIDKLVHELADLHADGTMIRYRTAMAIEELLTPAQVAKFRELRAKREAERQATHPDVGDL